MLEEARKIGCRALEFSPRSASTFCVVQVLQPSMIQTGVTAMRIVLAVDGSAVSARAARHAAMLYQQFAVKPELIVIFADEPILRGFAAHLGAQGVEKYRAENAQYALKGVRRSFKRARIPFTEHLPVGPPAQTIVKFVKSSKCEQLIMGSHGRGAFKNLVLGSVATKVLSQCKVPITFVR